MRVRRKRAESKEKKGTGCQRRKMDNRATGEEEEDDGDEEKSEDMITTDATRKKRNQRGNVEKHRTIT